MALWQVINTRNGELGEQYEDGLKAKPGEPGFTSELAEAYAGAKNFNYIGTPNWELPAEPEADATKESAP